MVERKEIGAIVIGFKDRLAMFGFKYLERYPLPRKPSMSLK